MTLTEVIGKKISYAKKLNLSSGGSPSGTGVYSPTGSDLAISTNNVERLKINSIGEVGIGGNPVNGVKLSATDGAVSVAVGYPSATLAYAGTLSNHGLYLITNNSPKVRIESNGDVGIGPVVPTRKLHVNGTVRLQGLPTYANNAAAIAGGLAAGDLFIANVSGEGQLRIVI